MLNEAFILQRIEPRLNAKRELSEFEFFQLFGNLTRQEHYQVIDLLIKHDIEYVDEKEEDEERLKAADSLLRTEERLDYKRLLHLTNEQLAVMAKAGEQAALAALIEKNRLFLYRVVKQHQKMHGNISMSEEDLFQEGCLGVMKAVERFDPSLDYYFLTYCGQWIRQAISRSIIDNGYMIRIPVHLFEQMRRVQNHRRKRPDLAEPDLVDWIVGAEREADRDITPERVVQCLVLSEYYLNTASLNSLVGEDQDTELQELVVDEEASSIPQLVEQVELHDTLEHVLDTLKPREAKVLRLRFGLDGGRGLTLEQVGNEYGLTRERIRQIEATALRKLRHPSRSHRLQAFWEE